MTKYTTEWRKANDIEEATFFFNIGVVANTTDESKARSSQFYLGKIIDRTLRYVLWGDEYLLITDRLTGDEVSTDYTEEIFSMTDEEIEELDETTYTQKSEALAARADKAEFDKLWTEIKARGE